MLTRTDLLRLDHTPDLAEAAILSTCQWLARSSRYLDHPNACQLVKAPSKIHVRAIKI